MDTPKTIATMLLAVYLIGAALSISVSLWLPFIRDPIRDRRRVRDMDNATYIRERLQQMWRATIWPVRLWQRRFP